MPYKTRKSKSKRGLTPLLFFFLVTGHDFFKDEWWTGLTADELGEYRRRYRREIAEGVSLHDAREFSMRTATQFAAQINRAEGQGCCRRI
jgi:hypothetical protein